MMLNGPAETKAYFGALLDAFSDIEFDVEASFGADGGRKDRGRA